MKQFTFKNNIGDKQVFGAASLLEAKELAIAHFNTFLVYPCHLELNIKESDPFHPPTEKVPAAAPILSKLLRKK